MKISKIGLLWTLVAASMHSGAIVAQDGNQQIETPASADRLAGHPAAKTILAESGFQGGLLVVAGHVDPTLLIALSNTPSTLAQGLVQDPQHLTTVRSAIREAQLYGRVSAIAWQDDLQLPYADSTVNLLVLTPKDPFEWTEDEIHRVLVPGGSACTVRDQGLVWHRKDWPSDVDHWTHSRYDATGNAVSRDQQAGPPQSLQWEAGPRWNRSVKTSGLVSTGGRIFYILDDSHFASNRRTWSLIARDAFNGSLLWRHELESWGGARGGKKVGPVQMHRRLVASQDRVYVTLGESAPVTAVDAVTGREIRTYQATEPAEEFLLSAGVLVAMVQPSSEAEIRRGAARNKRLVAVDPETGHELWSYDAAMILPMTLAADGRQVVFHDGRVIQSLDVKTGVPRWTSPPTGQKIVFRDQAGADSPGAEPSTILLAPQFAPTLIIYDDVVAFAGGRQLNVVAADDGRELWRAPYAASNYSVPVDLFGFQGCLWGPDKNMNLWRPLDDDLDFIAWDPHTGETRKTVRGNYGFPFQHHRCHQMKVVDQTVIAARAGIEFLDTTSGDVAAHHWTRGSCYFGVLPANGLLYVPPHDCACYVRAKLSGFLAMRSQKSAPRTPMAENRRRQIGPAYGKTQADATDEPSEDWPTYRSDMARTGRTATQVDKDLLLGWQTTPGGGLTSPVIAQQRVYVASVDQHTLHALDADTGQSLWDYTFDARVDSPPTVYQGLVLCGCRDGSVHALRAVDGQLVWRFQAADHARLIVSQDQWESTWPVSGSVLVVDDTVYFTSGRSSYLDGGIRLYGLKPHSGEVVVDTRISSRQPDGSQRLDDQGVDGCLNDILSSDGQRIFLRHQAFDLKGNALAERFVHLHGADGFLSFDSTSRLLWTYAPLFTSVHQGAFYDQRLSRMLFPSGRILVEGDEVVYGFGQNHYDQPQADRGGHWALFAAEKASQVPLNLSAIEYRKLALAEAHAVPFRWWTRLPIQVWAMVRTKDLLWVAGPVSDGDVSPAALDGRAEALLLAVCPSQGQVVADMPLPAPPVWDGMAAAAGQLYLTLTDGQVLCLWSAASGRPGTPLTPSTWRIVLPPVERDEEPGLIGRWRFDEGIGGLARDSSPQDHDAVVNGRWAEGDFGACLIAEGTPRGVVIPDAPHLHFGNDDFTLALWVQVDRGDVRLLGKEAFPENWWVINVLEDRRAELVLGEGRGAGRSVRATTARPLASDAWNHLVAVVDRGQREVRWYVNGQADSRHAIPETMTEGIHAAGRDLLLPSNHKPFRGLIGDLRLYRQAPTPDRIQAWYDEQSTRYTSTEYQLAN